MGETPCPCDGVPSLGAARICATCGGDGVVLDRHDDCTAEFPCDHGQAAVPCPDCPPHGEP